MTADWITFVLSNFTLTFLVIGLSCSLAVLLRQPKPLNKRQILEALFSYFLLFNYGISFFYNFIMHVFFAETAASFIGWRNSPFQYEVGFASLGFAVVGILAFRQSLSFRAASVIGPSLFLWGAAGGHVYRMISNHNFAPGNAGVVFWTDVTLPIIGAFLLYQQYQLEILASARTVEPSGTNKRRLHS
jgi:Family of unknown function (DUF6790)